MIGTKLFRTDAGVDIRVDTKPCRMKLKLSEGVCQLDKQILYARFKGLDGNLRSCAAIICEHQKMEYGAFVWWSEEMLITLFNEIHLGKTFSEIDAIFRNKFPDINFPPGRITRKKDGSYKEFDTPFKKKWADVKLNRVLIDVWRQDILVMHSSNAVDWPGRSFKLPHNQLERFDDTIPVEQKIEQKIEPVVLKPVKKNSDIADLRFL